MLPLPEVIRLSLLETARLSDEKLLKRTHGDILASLEGPSDARVGRDTLVLCAEVALKVSSSYHQCPRSESTLPEVHDLFAAQPVNQKKIRVPHRGLTLLPRILYAVRLEQRRSRLRCSTSTFSSRASSGPMIPTSVRSSSKISTCAELGSQRRWYVPRMPKVSQVRTLSPGSRGL